MTIIRGTNRPDRLVGDNTTDLIYGLGGDDIIRSGTGRNNEIYAGTGDDVIYGGRGRDQLLSGGTGADAILLGSHSTSVYAGSGNDYVYAHKGDAFLVGGAGDDTLVEEAPESAYSVYQDDQGYTYIDRKDGSQGEIVEKGFEHIQYAVDPNAETVTRLPDGTVDPRGVNANGFQDFGVNNGARHVSSVSLSLEGTQNYLRPHDRNHGAAAGPIRVDPDGVTVYAVSDGMQTATRTNASFDYGLITGGLDQLNATKAQILIDGDLSQNTSYTVYNKQPAVAGHDAEYVVAGTNDGFGGHVTPPAGISENSANLGFTSIAKYINGGNYQGQDGLIDVIYRQVDAHGVAQDNHIRLQVGQG